MSRPLLWKMATEAQVAAAKALFAPPRTLLLLADDELGFQRTFPRGKGKGAITPLDGVDAGAVPRTLYAVYSAGVGQLTVEPHIERIKDYTAAVPKTKKDDKVRCLYLSTRFISQPPTPSVPSLRVAYRAPAPMRCSHHRCSRHVASGRPAGGPRRRRPC